MSTPFINNQNSADGLTNVELRASPVPVDIGDGISLSVSGLSLTIPSSGASIVFQGTSPWLTTTPGGSSKVYVQNFGDQFTGQASSDGSMPVVLASDQSDVNVIVGGTTITRSTGSGAVVAYQGGTWNLTTTAGSSQVQLLGTAVVSGNVNVLNFPATQPVSGNVNAAQLGTWVVSGNVNVLNLPATQPVSGNVNILNLVTAVVSGNINVLSLPPVTLTGSGAVISYQGSSPWVVSAPTSAFGFTIQGNSRDNSPNIGHPVLVGAIVNPGTVYTNNDRSSLITDTTGNLRVTVGVAGATLNVSGNVNVVGLSTVTQIMSGNVNIMNTVPVTITGTQLVSGNINVFQNTSPWVTNVVGTGTVLAAQSGSWNVAATQFGTWTVTQGTPASTPWLTNTPGGSSSVQVIGSIPTLATQVGTWVVTGNVNILNVPGVSQSGTWTVQPGNTPNTVPWLTNTPGGSSAVQVIGTVPVTISGTQPISGNINVLNFPATQPVSGNVNVVNLVTAVVTGNVNILGTVPVSFSGIQSVSGNVNIMNTVPVSLSGTQLVSGNINVLNTLPVHPVTLSGSGAVLAWAGDPTGWLTAGQYNVSPGLRTNGNKSILETDVSGNLRVTLNAVGTTASVTVTGSVKLADGASSTTFATIGVSGGLHVGLSAGQGAGWNPFMASNLIAVTVISSGGCKFGGYSLINLNSYPVYLQCFNKDQGTAVTLGTTVPDFLFVIPANSTYTNGVMANVEFTSGIACINGLKVAATTTALGNTAVASGVIGTLLYR